MTHSGFKRSALKTRRAFSLAELMIATGILGIGMIIVAMAFPVALDQSRVTVELTTSQSVFNEAVNTLKTKTNAVRLATLFGGAGGSIGTNIRRIDQNFLAGLTVNDFEFSSDNTYGWMAAVQKISNQTYKFWIFVLREPTGIMDGTDFKFHFVSLTQGTHFEYYPPVDERTKNIRVTPPANAYNFPARQMSFLGDKGKIYRITDFDVANLTVACDQWVSDGEPLPSRDDLTDLAYPEARNNTVKITRKNPVVAVFETVINY